jgi:hypothetical protein
MKDVFVIILNLHVRIGESSLAAKWLGHEADRPLPSCVKGKNGCSFFTFTPPCHHDVVLT